MDFDNLSKTWDSFGKKDPMKAILDWDGKEGRNWKPEEFFKVGEEEISFIINEVEKRLPFEEKNRSLDFGCGVGRLTFPLAEIFKESHGLDISEQMIIHASKHCIKKGKSNCTFHHNRKEHLGLFKDAYFDFILSIIVLQHMEPRYFLRYITEFLRILKYGGILIFQLPDTTENYAPYEQYTDEIEPVMEMFGKGKDDIVAYIEKHEGQLIDVVEDSSCGENLKSYRYFVTK